MQKDWGQFIDREQLSHLSGGDTSFETELLAIYVQDTLHQLKHLEQAAAQANAPTMRIIAHHIKGASANVGAVSIAKIAAEIETAAQDGPSDSIAADFARLRQQVDALRSCL